MNTPAREGNRVALLENGEEFFPRVMELIDGASVSIYVETFILADDRVGRELQEALVAASARGVSVDVLADGFGSDQLSTAFRARFAEAGVRLHLYEPRRRLLGMRTNLFRRMHRKITIIDARVAFVGGINYCCDQLVESGPESLHDFAAEVEGPVVADIVKFIASTETSPPVRSFRLWRRRERTVAREAPQPGKGARVRFLTRDNHHHRNDIELEYRRAIASAKHEVLIANAYFLPGYRLLRELRLAAQRGVAVTVIVQGRPDMRIVSVMSGGLSHYIVPQGIRVLEYCIRPMHAKVAVVDGHWSTVGSSNLDPLSLALNLEANLFIEDIEFRNVLNGRLQRLIREGCREVTPDRMPPPTPWRTLQAWCVYHVLRHFPKWAGWIPAHRPRIEAVTTPADASSSHEQGDDAQGGAKRTWRRVFWLAFTAVVLALLFRAARSVDWDAVGAAVTARAFPELGIALAIALASYALYGLMDVLGRTYAGHRLARWRTWLTAMTCYALSLNLGGLVGGFGMRVRLYGKQGVSALAATRTTLASMIGNWTGCIALLTLAPLWMRGDIARTWTAGLDPRWLSAMSAMVLLGYFSLCARGMVWRWRTHSLQLPDLRTATAQCGLAAANWAVMAGALHVCLGDEVAYGEVLITLLVAALAGAITHVPAGWGVLEFVAVSMLHTRPSHEVVAGVLVYRVLYYLVPLGVALVAYAWRERWTGGEKDVRAVERDAHAPREPGTSRVASH